MIFLISFLLLFLSCCDWFKNPVVPDEPEEVKYATIVYDYYGVWDSTIARVTLYTSWIGERRMTRVGEAHWQVTFDKVPVNYGEYKWWEKAFKVTVLNSPDIVGCTGENLFANEVKLTNLVSFSTPGRYSGTAAVHRVDENDNIYNIN